ncbi:MAG TPA: thiosulfate reductase [Desulfobulbaceae bacterium]|nr:thiosulfate reductase [Desulfobulbaceae bacterium]
MKKTVYSICGMCAVRCPVSVTVDGKEPVWIEGNSNDGGMGKSLCAKGGATLSQRLDSQRPTSPMIRTGERGEGQWKNVSWDEAFDYISDKLKGIIAKDGARSVIFSDRGGPFADLRKAFMKAIGSPNYHNHDCTCGRNTHHASKSVYGLGRKAFAYDYKNANHIVLFGRNITESIKVKEAKGFIKGVNNGAHVTYIDPRVTNTTGKATRYWQIKPGTDYALLLGITHYILKKEYYDKGFVKKWVTGLPKLKTFLKPYTPEWAEKETGISAEEIKTFCEEINEDRPKVIFHPGWMLARYSDSFYASRMIHILNALMGSIEVPGGLFYPKTPKDAGSAGLKSLGADIPAPEEKERADGCGTRYPQFDKGPGMFQLTYEAIDTGKPYPIKAYFVQRHNPLIALPDTEEQKRILNKLDLIVATDVYYSEIAWFADVILPESTYIERDSILRTEKGLKPGFGRRQKCVEPMHDTRAGWEIYVELAKRLGKGEYFPYESIEDIWNYQLQDTKVKIEDFDEKGFVKLAKDPIWYDRDKLKFGTESGKIEIVNKKWDDIGIPSLKPYESPVEPAGGGEYRLIFGRTGYQAHGMHHNNPILSQLLGSNKLWINADEAAKLGIGDGDEVEVVAGDTKGTIEAKVTDFIHPQAVFMLHGFGKDIPAQERAFGKGLADQVFMKGKLKKWDKAGGGISLMESFVTVKALS